MASTTEKPPAPAEAASPAARVLKQELGAEVLKVEEFRGDLAITVTPGAWVRAATLLKTRPELDFKLFLDLCGVDHLDDEDRRERFEVVLHLYSVSGRLRAPRGEHRPLAPGHARDVPRAGAHGRGDDRGGRGRDRLHAPELREDGGGPDLLADHPLHRPAELLLLLHERPRLGAGGGEAARNPRAPARGSDPRDLVRVLADHGPLRLHRDQRGGPGRDHALLLTVLLSRGDLRVDVA